MSNDRHINFKILRDRILKSEPACGSGRFNVTDQPLATASGSDKTYWRNLEELRILRPSKNWCAANFRNRLKSGTTRSSAVRFWK
jgi:hypothetical protein